MCELIFLTEKLKYTKYIRRPELISLCKRYGVKKYS